MKTVIYAKTELEARRSRRPKVGETVAYRAFSEFDGVAEKGFNKFEIIGSCDITDKIEKAYNKKGK